MIRESAFDGILVNVILVMQEILVIPNPVIRESALPDFSFAANKRSKGVRVSALDELDGAFEGDVACWR